MFHSTNLAAAGSRLFSGSCCQKVPRREVSEAIERQSSTFLLQKNVITMSRSVSLRAEARRLL